MQQISISQPAGTCATYRSRLVNVPMYIGYVLDMYVSTYVGRVVDCGVRRAALLHAGLITMSIANLVVRDRDLRNW
jgi:hypothetical protein